MKRFHVHLSVPDLQSSIGFYSRLFGAEPTVRKDDYAKWMIDDPRVNFAISSRGARAGLNHLGLQADSADELAAIGSGFSAADSSTVVTETEAQCCYAVSNKHWVQDPQGIPWEAFHSLDTIPIFGGASDGGVARAAACGARSDAPAAAAASGCCAPGPGSATKRSSGCCA